MKPDAFAPTTARRWRSRGELAPVVGASTNAISAQHHSSQEWHQLRAAIMDALQPYPEARESLVRALRTLDANPQDPQ